MLDTGETRWRITQLLCANADQRREETAAMRQTAQCILGLRPPVDPVSPAYSPVAAYTWFRSPVYEKKIWREPFDILFIQRWQR